MPTNQTSTLAKLPSGIAKMGKAYRAHPGAIMRRPGFNPRFDFGEIDVLAKSIKANGVLNPLRVKRIPEQGGKVFELIDGDRRLTALELLMEQGEKFEDGVPVVLVDKEQDDITSLVQMFEANASKQFLPLEEAAAFKTMRDAGMTIKDICQRTGRADVHVMDTLSLLEADDSLKEAVASKQIGTTLAKQIATVAKGDKAKQAELVAAAKQTGKDKGKKAAVAVQIRKAQVERAAKKGKVLKMRALTDAQLTELGARVAKYLLHKAQDAGFDLYDGTGEALTALREVVAKDDKLAAAYTLGALEALRAGAGIETDLDI